MALTRDFKATVKNRITSDHEYATALLRESVELMVDGDYDTAKLILRDLVNSTIGFEVLASELNKSSKSVHRMLSLNGNPTMENISAIFAMIKTAIGIPNQVCRDDTPKITQDDKSKVLTPNKDCAPLIRKIKRHIHNFSAARQIPKWEYASQ